MSAVLGTLAVKLSAKTAEFNRAIDSANGKLSSISGAAAKVAGASAASFAALGAGVGVIASKFAAFEMSMTRVGAVSQATGAQMGELNAAARGLAQSTQFTAKEVADGMGFMAMAGFEVNEVISTMPSVAQLAAAGMMDIAQAADITTNILTGMGLETRELGRANDVLVSAMSGANTSVSQMGEAFKYVGPVAKAAGVSFEEVTSAIALMGNAGIQGSMAGTTMRGAITKLLNPSAEAAALMKRLGLEFKNSSGDLIGFSDIIGQLEQKGASASDMMEIFGLRAGPGMAALVEQGSAAFLKFEDRLRSSEGIANRISTQVLNTLGGRFKILMSAISEAGLAIAKGIVPHVKDLIGFVGGLVKAFNSMNSETKAFAGEILIAGTAVAGIATALSTLVAVGPILLPMLGAIAGAFLPVVLASVLVVAAIAGIVFHVGLLRKAWKSNFLGIQDIFESTVGAMKDLWDGFVGGITTALGYLQRAFIRIRGVLTGEAASVTEKKVLQQQIVEEGGTIEPDKKLATDTGLMRGIKSVWNEGVGFFKDTFKGLIPDFSSGTKKAVQEGTALGVKEIETLVRMGIQKGMDRSKPTTGEAAVAALVATESSALTPQFQSTGFQRFGTQQMEGLKVFEDINQGELVEPIKESTKSIGKALMAGAAIIQGRMGEVGGVISSAASGFQSGGPFGALIAVFADLLSRTKAFKDISERGNQVLEDVVGNFEPLGAALKPLAAVLNQFVFQISQMLVPLFQALSPILTAFAELLNGVLGAFKVVIGGVISVFSLLLGSLGGVSKTVAPLTDTLSIFGVLISGAFSMAISDLTMIFGAIGPVIEFLGNVLSNVGNIIMQVVKGVAGVFNGILKAISGVIRWIADISVLGKRPFKFLDEFADRLDRAQINVSAFGEVEMPAFQRATEEAKEEMKGLNQELSNVPEGFKIDLRRYQSAVGESGGASPEGSARGNTMIYIQALDLEEAGEKLDKIGSFNRFVGGSATTQRVPFSVAREGG